MTKIEKIRAYVPGNMSDGFVHYKAAYIPDFDNRPTDAQDFMDAE